MAFRRPLENCSSSGAARVRQGARVVHLAQVLLVVGLVQACGCQSVLRTRGSEPETPRPVFEEASAPEAEYRVWLLVPWLQVNVYPQHDKTQQPMLQFTGDVARLEQGWGSLAVLVAPDRFVDGQPVTFFEDKILWEERLRLDDPREFSLWLRENNRSAPTRFDGKLKKVERVAEAVEEISGLSGFKIPARRAINVSVQTFKELQQDWLILHWRCPWRHVIQAAEARLGTSRREVVLSARLQSKEQHEGQPVAELSVLFVVRRLDKPLPAGLGE